MILYTPVPPEVIWQSVNEETQPRLEEVVIDQIQVQVSRTKNNEIMIERILSTDPQVYLDKRFQPGMSVFVEPVIKK
ncbi:MAG: YlzJ-like family protein [Bacillota bacterium]|uniref:Ribonuclease n=1 Tax=Thermanaerosceptrum fracticalcis TaxID=1712410 RepID=A0A7G6E0V3_THEFR|nr:YlzJ-like family protein [Thermanaerosceptrum fracticalcis]QNB45707.1 ribonuclease [Thermanaerosceptrum fracticalcis]